MEPAPASLRVRIVTELQVGLLGHGHCDAAIPVEGDHRLAGVLLHPDNSALRADGEFGRALAHEGTPDDDSVAGASSLVELLHPLEQVGDTAHHEEAGDGHENPRRNAVILRPLGLS
eukprot:CAMPEP_0170245892 /NCGR_PEP_ID=MMETSP0116_2-20130129/22732_1 /TAXON_ID=400756 /ORGANISM="Durinskia baltica, Strain CSIRO CS-38" /LENGTH=116 /DNA_ID=CAMNT_0010496767 /DNA_START=39 /DNA_END=389 /DNA_ORIENTATION=-